jgi:hypothetical protein
VRSGRAESPCGASLANGPSLRESDQEPALIGLTVGVMQQRTGRPRPQIAINNASVTSCALISGFIDQPTTRRENRSITAAR